MSNLANVKRICPQCGREFQIRSNNQVLCSKECAKPYYKARRVRIHEEVMACSNR